MSGQRDIRIHVPVLARVEGEGALEFSASGGCIQALRLRIFEPPRYFERFLEGREHREIPDIVARICGICPVAYQMSAVQAIEQAFGVAPDPWALALRRVMYCGEWIQSHALHIHLLAAPDFLGYESVIEMAKDHPEAVRRGLALQGLGNALIRLCGARSVHPVGVCPGGFYHAPSLQDTQGMLERLQAALPEAEATLRWTASLDLPEDDQVFINVALRHRDEYAMYGGRMVSDSGLDVAIPDYERHFAEYHQPHSTALYSSLDGQPYLVGPLARVNLNRSQLGRVAGILDQTGVAFPSRNMFHSIVARAAEVLYAIGEAMRLLQDYRLPQAARVPVTPRAGVGFGATEAPRGLLWHRYEFDARGRVVSARIVPPTAQNQARMEQDLRSSLERYGLDRDDEAIRLRGETVIRNYDPCISCATHFLKVKVHRGGASAGGVARHGSGEQARPLSAHAMNPVRILGMGSPFGADRIGWQAIDALGSAGITQDYPPGWVSLLRLDRPGARLLEAMAGAEAVILIDAMRSGAPPGTLRRLHMDQLEALVAPLSSHGLGVAAALRLARSLGQLPARLVIMGVEIGARSLEPDALNDTRILEGALAGLITLVTQELERIHRGRPG